MNDDQNSPAPVVPSDPFAAPQPVVQPVTPAPPAPQPPTPAPPKQKEMQPPAPAPVSEAQVHDTAAADVIAKEEGDVYWENYAREIELEKEIAEMGGVEKVESGEVKLPDNLAKEMGIKPAVNIQTPLDKVSDFTVRGISLGDDQLATGKKLATSSGFRWLVEWFIYELLKAHYLVKFVKGRFSRSKTS